MVHTINVCRRQTRWPGRLALFTLLLAACLFTPAGAQVSGGRLPTRWDKDVSPSSPLPEYPRPQMVRKQWLSLNGPWDYALSAQTSATAPTAYTGKILVPYPYEAALSGVGKPSIPDQRLWYRRTFRVPTGWKGGRVLLHFGAVNWDSTVSINGKPIGAHRGGFDAFSFDVTDALQPGANELIVSAWNPIRSDVPDAQVIGKQRVHPGGIFYTGATGIWQTVWLEPVPTVHITSLKLTPDVDAGTLNVTVNVDRVDPTATVEMVASAGGHTVSTGVGAPGRALVLPVPKSRLWSPDSPFLYDLMVRIKRGDRDEAPTLDQVGSYFAMRKISLGKDAQGRSRPFLNNKFVFQVGALDQGYWPDGIYTAPTDDALKYDIQMAKKFGFNLLRKHAKVEPDRWYYWADRLGILVWQDMPQAFGNLNDEAKAQWEAEWRREIAGFANHPSIIVWTTFNEGWGQHDTESIVALTKQLDPSRLVNNASGWTDKGVGDIADTHAYPGPWSGKPEPTRAAVNGEFGGITMRVPGHVWTTGEVMGYGATLQEGRLVTKRYQQLLRTGYGLMQTQGTSALVYTQLTDVEQEINGLMTYDRAIIKPDISIVAAANKGQFLPLPPNPNPDLVPTSDDEAQIWRYTTDRPVDAWMQTGFDDTAWKSGPAPFGHDMGGVRTVWTASDIWIRRRVTLPANLPPELTFLVKHDEDAEIYVNGVLAGSVAGYAGDYVPVAMTAGGRAALKSGVNVLAVHCHNTVGGQGIDVGIAKAAEKP